MNPNLIAAAVLFGPAAFATPALAYRVIAGRRETAAVAAVLDELRAEETDSSGKPQPPQPGDTTPAMSIASRRRAA